LVQILSKERIRELSDEELVSRFKNDDSSSFVELVDRYKRGLYRMFYRTLRNPADAEDMTQEVFLRAYANLKDFRGDSSFKTWLYRIAINLVTNLKKSGRYNKEIIGEESVSSDTRTNPKLLETLIDKDRAELVKNAMNSLPEKQRITLSLRLEKDLKNREIAEILGCPVGTVKANLFHAICRLRKILEETGYEFR